MIADEKNTSQSPGFLEDVKVCWALLPNKAFFFILLVAWYLVFALYGNGTFGYARTSSLFGWMKNAYGDPFGDGQDGHGQFIPFVVLALFWVKRRELLAVRMRTWWPSLLMIAAGLGIHILGFMAQQARISIIGMFLSLYGLTGLAWGKGWLKASFFPFFLFVFCMPISSIADPVTFPLRLFVAKVVQFICVNIIGIDVLRDGTELFNAAHTYGYDIAAACSGMQSIVAIFALCTIYAFLFLKEPWRRIVMIGAALPLSMISNVVRLLCIIIAAELFGKSTGDYVHESNFFSMLPYIPGIIGVWFLGGWLEKEPKRPEIKSDSQSHE